MTPTTQALITAVRRYLGDREPGQAGGDLADVWAAIEAAEAEQAAPEPCADAT